MWTIRRGRGARPAASTARSIGWRTSTRTSTISPRRDCAGTVIRAAAGSISASVHAGAEHDDDLALGPQQRYRVQAWVKNARDTIYFQNKSSFVTSGTMEAQIGDPRTVGLTFSASL